MKQNPCSQKSRCRFTSQHPLWGQCWHHAIRELLQQHLVEHHKIVVSSVHWALESLQWRKEEDQSIHSLDSSTCTIFFGAANTISSLAQNSLKYPATDTDLLQNHSGFIVICLLLYRARVSSKWTCRSSFTPRPGRPSATALKVSPHNWSTPNLHHPAHRNHSRLCQQKLQRHS